jgi:hypothetical protein
MFRKEIVETCEMHFKLKYLLLFLNHGSGVYSTSNRNEYQNISGGKEWPECKVDNLTATYKPIV